MKGCEQRRIQHRSGAKVDRVQALVGWSHKGQKRSTSLVHSPPWWELAELKAMYQIVMYTTWGGTGTLFYPWIIVSFKKKKIIYLAAPVLNRGMWNLVPWPGIESRPPALGMQSLSHWTTRVLTLNYCFLTAFLSFLHSLDSLKIIEYWDLFKDKHCGQS